MKKEIAYEEVDENKLENYEVLYQYGNNARCITQSHYHRFVEILYCISGKQKVVINDTDYFLTPDTMIIIPPNMIHSVYSVTDDEFKYAVLKFAPETICSERQSIYEFNLFFSSLFYLPEKELLFTKEELISNPKILHAINEIFVEEQLKGYAYKFAVRVKLSEIFLNIMRLRRTTTTTTTTTTSVAELVSPEIKNRFLEIFNYIDDHYSEDIEAEDLMFMAGLSHTAFTTNLKLLTGKTFKEYLTQVRISKSKKLLATTELSVAQVARAVGFDNSSYFAKLFKERMGCTPLKFKSEMKENPLTVNHYNLIDTETGKNHYFTE